MIGQILTVMSLAGFGLAAFLGVRSALIPSSLRYALWAISGVAFGNAVFRAYTFIGRTFIDGLPPFPGWVTYAALVLQVFLAWVLVMGVLIVGRLVKNGG